MRFSKFVVGLSIIDNPFVEGLSARPDDFDKMIFADITQGIRWEGGFDGIRWWGYSSRNDEAFRDWLSQEHPPYSMIREQCRVEFNPTVPEKMKSVLEKMSLAAHFLPLATIRGPARALCLLAYVATSTTDDAYLQNSVNETIEIFWRNLIAEYFIKTSDKYRVFYQSPTFEDANEYNPSWMRRLANRCDIVATEQQFINSFSRLGWFHDEMDRYNMGSKEIFLLCKSLQAILKTGNIPKARVDDLHLAKQFQTQRLELLGGFPTSLSAQVCYYQLIPEDSKTFIPIPVSPPFLSTELSDLIAQDLEMNRIELREYCNIVKHGENHEKDRLLTQFALRVMNRILEKSFENFRLYTGQTLPQSAESRYYAFVARASKQFDFSSILAQWKSHPILLPEAELICGDSIDPPRLSPHSELWNTMKRWASVEYPSLTEPEKREFCIFVHELVQDFRSTVPGELLKIAARLDNLEALIPINKATPQINEICGQRITRMIRSGTGIPQLENLAVLDGLVAEAALISGKTQVCDIISEWNRGTLTEEDLISHINRVTSPTPAAARVVALPPAHDAPAPTGRRGRGIISELFQKL